MAKYYDYKDNGESIFFLAKTALKNIDTSSGERKDDVTWTFEGSTRQGTAQSNAHVLVNRQYETDVGLNTIDAMALTNLLGNAAGIYGHYNNKIMQDSAGQPVHVFGALPWPDVLDPHTENQRPRHEHVMRSRNETEKGPYAVQQIVLRSAHDKHGFDEIIRQTRKVIGDLRTDLTEAKLFKQSEEGGRIKMEISYGTPPESTEIMVRKAMLVQATSAVLSFHDVDYKVEKTETGVNFDVDAKALKQCLAKENQVMAQTRGRLNEEY